MVRTDSLHKQIFNHYGLVSVLIALVMSLAFSSAWAQTRNNILTASVDRKNITVNDIITLTIRMGALYGNDLPSLDALDENFERHGTSRSTMTLSINGIAETVNEFRINLQPKTTGTFIIPSLRKGAATTEPIEITVSEATQLSGTSNEEIFLRTTLSKNSVYVQEQLVYTIKLYYSIRFDQGAQLSNPQVEDSVIEPLGSDQTYTEIVEGISYDVTERKFVIYPQKSGELLIPPVYFAATVGGRSSISRLLSRNTPVRQISLASDSYQIEVKGIPEAFDGSTWLPASELTVRETLSGDLENLEVGESVTRNLVMTAKGLSSSLLPEMTYEPVAGLRFYPDQPVRNNSEDSTGITGVRAEGTAIVPAEEGSYTLPEIRIPWWNVDEDHIEYATIPARSVSVSGGLPAGVQPAPVVPQNNGIDPNLATAQGSGGAAAANPFLITSTVLFALAWLGTIFLWMRTKEEVGRLKAMGVGQGGTVINRQSSDADNLPKPENSLRYMQQACEQNNLSSIRMWAITWGQAFFRDRQLKTLDQLSERCESNAIKGELDALERALYSSNQNSSEFDSAVLLKEIVALNRKGFSVKKNKPDNESLPPLYKN